MPRSNVGEELPGSYCPSPSVSPIMCPAGNYSGPGATTCQSCTPGTFTLGRGLPRYSMNGTACAGTKCCTIGAADCISPLCGVGIPTMQDSRSQQALGHQAITSCTGPASMGATTCTVCPAGYSCDNPALAPTPCMGKYSSNAGATACSSQSCSPGTFAVPTACVGAECGALWGWYYMLGGATLTTSGAILNHAGQLMVGALASIEQGSSQCKPCPPGFSCADPDQLPVPCATGLFSATGAPACSTCPAGSHTAPGLSFANVSVIGLGIGACTTGCGTSAAPIGSGTLAVGPLIGSIAWPSGDKFIFADTTMGFLSGRSYTVGPEPFGFSGMRVTSINMLGSSVCAPCPAGLISNPGIANQRLITHRVDPQSI
jgi:hypothetical protein